MMSNEEIKLSVHQLIEFALKSGSLDDSFASNSRAVQGTRAHIKLQKHRKKELGDNYTTEVSLSYPIELDGIVFVIEGRADGIIIEENQAVLEEIKSTYCPLELIDEGFNPMHWAQAKVYGYIYAVQNSMQFITVQLTYYNLDSENYKSLRISYAVEELKDFFESMIHKLWSWFSFIKSNIEQRNESIVSLEFPFLQYRKNQREFAVAVYKTIQEGSDIFVQAPTGTGKTISTLFPALKALGEGHISKIFYLTAKTITRQVAEDTIRLLMEKGLKAKTVVLTAKDKICFCLESSCKAESCIYAEGYFDRIDAAMMDILENGYLMNRESIEDYARLHRVCPFEFSLDLALWVDIVICDYNYVFDPRAYLKRFFGESSESSGQDRRYALLVDEAHNLVDRSRDMYTAELTKSAVLEQKRFFKDLNKQLYKALTETNKLFIEMRKKADEKHMIDKELPKELCKQLRRLVADFEQVLQQNSSLLNANSLTLYFDILFFLKISELFNENYVNIMQIGRDVSIKLFCIDPSKLLQEKIQKAKSSVFFSATLLPMPYYVYMLGGTEKSYTMRMPSAFSSENLGLYVYKSISTKYKDREKSMEQVALSIHTAISSKTGNYVVYSPSYSYMQDIIEAFEKYSADYEILIQQQNMNEESKESFLQSFQTGKEKTMVAFAVMGGIFSEGIDLKGERLSGAIIVGVGLPLLCVERDIIKEHFDRQKGAGFDYAYKFPGMNKVQQAAGRVIRTETDKGIVILIDQRFGEKSYKALFPKEWEHAYEVQGILELEAAIKGFWNKHME